MFPGLWLIGPALLKGDLAAVLTCLQQGLQTPEHTALLGAASRRAEIPDVVDLTLGLEVGGFLFSLHQPLLGLISLKSRDQELFILVH